MDGFYQSVESSLLAFALALGLAVTFLVANPASPFAARSPIEIVLPMVDVVGDAP